MDQATSFNALEEPAEGYIINDLLHRELLLLTHVHLTSTLDNFDCVEELPHCKYLATAEEPHTVTHFAYQLLLPPIV